MAHVCKFYRYLKFNPFGIEFKMVVETLKKLPGRKKMDIEKILEQDRVMSSFEDGRKEGREEERKICVMELQESALSQLKERFKRIPRALARQIKAVKDYSALLKINILFGGAKDLEDAERRANMILATA
ncbi:MAG: hypothetical protein LBR22_02035 [Desulfovibrio sp.]|nr:hypothetical protein [Desulfovibrio sp.]